MSIKRAGVYEITKAELKTRTGKTDISNQIDNIQIFEAIDTPFMTGSIVLSDTQDFLSQAPLVGDEELHLIIETPDVDVIDRNFFVYKLTDLIRVGVSKKIYALHFISIEARENVNVKLSKAFSGEISEIVKEVAENLNPEIDVLVEPSRLNAKYISPFWSPVKNIHYCGTLAENDAGSSSYMFFENRLGFNFASVEGLYKLEPAFEWYSDLYNRRGDPQNLDEIMKRVEGYRVLNSYDTLESNVEGVYSSTRFFYDPFLKQHKEQPYDYFDLFQDFAHLNEYPITTNKFYRSPMAHISNEYKFTNKFLDENLELSDKQIRRSHLRIMDNQKLEIEVYGRMDYTVGLTALMTVYSNKPVRETDPVDEHIDPILSGRYLISAVNHYFTRDDHRCVIELIKESNL